MRFWLDMWQTSASKLAWSTVGREYIDNQLSHLRKVMQFLPAHVMYGRP